MSACENMTEMKGTCTPEEVNIGQDGSQLTRTKVKECSGMDGLEDDLRNVDRGWSWVVMMASFGGFCLIGATEYAVGIIHSTLLEQFRENVATTSWAGALHSALISGGGPLSSAVIDHVSCRMAIVLSGLCYMTGYFITALAPNIGVAIFSTGIISGLGGAFGFTACLVVVGFNFHHRRSIALGIANSGIGFGMFVFAPLMQWSRTYYGTRGFFIVLAAMSANLITIGSLCFPSSLERSAQRIRKVEHARRTETTQVRCHTLRGYGRVALNKSIMCLSLSMFNYCIGSFIIYLYLPSYVVHNGFTATEASYFVAISGISSVVGRIVTGFIANLEKMPDIALYSGAMSIVAISTAMYPLYCGSLVGNVFYSLVLGLFFGSCYVVMPNVTIQHIGINYMAAGIGLELFLGGLGSLIGPVVAGIIVDGGGSYDSAFILAGFCKLLAAILGLASSCFHDRSFQSKDFPDPGEMELCVEEMDKTIADPASRLSDIILDEGSTSLLDGISKKPN